MRKLNYLKLLKNKLIVAYALFLILFIIIDNVLRLTLDPLDLFFINWLNLLAGIELILLILAIVVAVVLLIRLWPSIAKKANRHFKENTVRLFAVFFLTGLFLIVNLIVYG